MDSCTSQTNYLLTISTISRSIDGSEFGSVYCMLYTIDDSLISLYREFHEVISMLDWQSQQRPFVLEIERGVLTLNVLSQLTERRYGYQIIQNLVDVGLAVDQGMIYPLLRKLEQQGLLVGDWIVGDTRPRRYYVLSEDGRSLLMHLTKEWKRIASIEDEFIRNDTAKEK